MSFLYHFYEVIPANKLNPLLICLQNNGVSAQFKCVKLNSSCTFSRICNYLQNTLTGSKLALQILGSGGAHASY